MSIDRLMSKELCAVDPETTLAEASTLMGERKIGSALVCKDGKLVGILTERDITRAMSNDYDAPRRPVAEWMTRAPVTATPETPVKEALRLMVDGGFRHLPICRDGEAVGIVSIRDLAKTLAEEE